jgi:hypothetical protein
MNPDKAVQQFMEDMELYDDELVKLQLHNLLMAVIFYLISVLATQSTYKE